MTDSSSDAFATAEATFYQLNPNARWFVLASICITLFIVPMSMSGVNMALPAIAAALHVDAVWLSWITTATLWGSIVLLLPAGRVADMVGRKPIFMLGLMGFSLASLLVFVVDSVAVLLWVRVLQGLFSSLIFATAMAIIATVFSDNNRGSALGFASTSVYLGLTCGPLIGGWLTEHVGWQGVFWGPLLLAIVAIILAFIYIRNDHRSAQPTQPLDWLGSLIFVAIVTLLLFGLSGLPDVLSGVMLVVGMVLVVVFVRYQNRCQYPLVRFSLLASNRVMSRSLMASFMMYSANYPVLFLLSLYLQYLQALSPSEAGQLILIQALIMAVLAPIAGRLSDRYEPRLIATIGCLFFGIGFVVLMFLQADSPLNHVMIALCLLGVGFGLFSTPNNNAALGAVPKERLSIASALLNLARTSGNMFSMAIVMMLMSQFFAGEQIHPERYPDLLLVVQLGFASAAGYSFLAAWFSYSRGNVTR
ncbi:MFS transporter [Amphritea sp. 1_MG-2023]|uniref:MFS transporter n=1 Tax=Amphritea sp. 1_MG-2023 TaxID=3062670 RepID=UPI0026E194CC|nr:MFS transporter [Amphritea sp. 1_MG-2023]MDO6563164.1 MFS transporter [Amphritea sp. 1_MG-2023]